MSFTEYVSALNSFLSISSSVGSTERTRPEFAETSAKKEYVFVVDPAVAVTVCRPGFVANTLTVAVVEVPGDVYDDDASVYAMLPDVRVVNTTPSVPVNVTDALMSVVATRRRLFAAAVTLAESSTTSSVAGSHTVLVAVPREAVPLPGICVRGRIVVVTPEMVDEGANVILPTPPDAV